MQQFLTHPSIAFSGIWFFWSFQNQSVAGNVIQQIKNESLTKPYKFCSRNISLKGHLCPVNLASAPKGSKNTIQVVYVICLQTYCPEVCQGPTIEYLSVTWLGVWVSPISIPMDKDPALICV